MTVDILVMDIHFMHPSTVNSQYYFLWGEETKNTPSKHILTWFKHKQHTCNFTSQFLFFLRKTFLASLQLFSSTCIWMCSLLICLRHTLFARICIVHQCGCEKPFITDNKFKYLNRAPELLCSYSLSQIPLHIELTCNHMCLYATTLPRVLSLFLSFPSFSCNVFVCTRTWTGPFFCVAIKQNDDSNDLFIVNFVNKTKCCLS